MRRILLAILVAMGVIGVVAACTGYDSEECLDDGSCVGPFTNDAGEGGLLEAGDSGGGDVGPDRTDAGCDLNASPHEALCVVSEANGVFVTLTGDDASADGTKAKPFGSIGAASIAAVTASKPRVFVCAGVWPTAAQITTAGDGVSIYGGFSCDAWTYEAATNHTIVAPSSGIALTIAQLVKGITIEDVDFVSANASTPGDSSIAVKVSSSQHVTFRRGKVTAGAGADGTTDTSVPLKPDAAKDGTTPADGVTSGGAAVSCACPYGDTSVGGKGGDSTDTTATDGENGAPGSTPNKGTTSADLLGCFNGSEGAEPTPSADGEPAKTLGTLSGAQRLWTPTAGTNGANGKSGQGGGGGGAKKSTTPNRGAGGGGACGGCGGRGGPGGAGGGASIGLLADTSDVSLEGVIVAAAKAGAGANGVAGQDGTGGGAGSNKAPHGTGCAGGTGGTGAKGGAGGGGAGGLSAAVAFSGAAPKVDAATTLTQGAGGAAGKGGRPGVNDGVAGDAKPSFEIK